MAAGVQQDAVSMQPYNDWPNDAGWFDGFTQTHRFELVPPSSGNSITSVKYSSRHQCNEMLEKVRKNGTFEEICFGQKQDPCESVFRKAMSTYHAATKSRQDAGLEDVNVGVTIHDHIAGMPTVRKTGSPTTDSLWLKSDNAWLQEIDASTLEPVGVCTQQKLHPELKGTLAAAHMRTDPVTGDYFNYNLEFGRQATYRFFKVSASTGKTEILATVRGFRAAYLHSFVITEKYLVFCIYSAYYAKGGVKILWTKNVVDAIDYDPNEKNKWLVIDRHHGKGLVAVFESDPFFAFHCVNAWDEPSTTEEGKTDITLDISTYENLDILKRFYYENMKSTSPSALNYAGPQHAGRARPSLHRYRLRSIADITISVTDAKASKAAELLFAAPNALSVELPTFNSALACKPSRYIYGVTDRGNSVFLDGLAKFDTETKEAKLWIRHAQSPGEPIFVADPEPKGEGSEDAGVLLSVVLDGKAGRSYLLCLDAGSFEEVGRVEMEGVVGFGFHGHFVPRKGV
ncbi:MAG: hypothetical protein LQ350_006652 [Teloschistes chrysophthalmus]|nr:MAG: hypothetical protein LQ350_006652 [Niorma chrysophthalma]